MALHHDLRSKLAAVVITSDQNLKDEVGWKLKEGNVFIVKSTYKLINGDNEATEQGFWRNIWSLRVPNKIRAFALLVRRGRIMCNIERIMGRFTPNDTCSFCATAREDMEHVIRRCSMAREVWQRVFFFFFLITIMIFLM